MNQIKEAKNLLWSELRRGLQLLKAYPLDTINNLISFIIVSIVLLFGINKLGNEVQLFGIIFFPIIMTLISGPSQSQRSDIEIGVFEQVYTSNYSILRIGVLRSIASALFSMVTSLVVGGVIYYFYYRINVNLTNMLFVLLTVVLLSLVLGILLFGITIIFRKTDTILNFINILILIELMFPYSQLHGILANVMLATVPFAGIIAYLQQAFTNDFFMNAIECQMLCLINLAFWTATSLFVYRKCLNKARLSGTLGQY